MKLLKCKLCMGEVDIVNNDRSINRKVKCRKCCFGPEQDKGPEVVVIRRRPSQ